MRHSFFRIGIIFALLITMGAGQMWAYDPHFYLTGETPTGGWSNSATAWFLVSPASDSYDQYCTYVWLSENDYFGLNNGENRYSRCDNNDHEIKDGYGSGQFGYPHDNSKDDKAFKYIGATGLVRINVSEADDNCGNTEHCREYYPWVWVNEGLEIGILKGEKVMFYFGSSTGKGEHNWLYLSTTSKTSHSASEQYHRLNETKCSSYISVAYVDAGVQYYISDYSSWGGMQMEENVIAGSLYSIYKENDVDKIYRNAGAIPHFSTTTVNKTVGTTDSEIAATVTNSIYGNEQVLYYYYTTDGGTTFTKFDPSDISSLAVGVYTVYALGWDGHILVRSDNSVTLNVGVTITLNANGGTDGDVTSVFATSGAAASTGNIAAASLPTKTGYTFNGFWTSGDTEVIDENGEWIADVSGYTDDSGNWTCSAASTLYAHWTPKTYTIRLQGMEADGGNIPIDVDVTYDGVLSQVTPHTKTNYTFDGYWVRNESTLALETQLIDANGNWIADVEGYTGNDGADNPTWVHDYAISLYAKWTEHPYNITLAVDPSAAPAGGSIQIGGVTQTSVNAYYVTETAEITAVPSNAAWRFKEWRFSKTGEDFDVYVSPGHGYSSTSNTITIKAEHDGTLTAVFEPRFYLVGVLYSTGEAGGGMPGWESASEYRAPFEVTSNSPLTASCTRQLDPNTAFMFLVRNRDNGLSYGYATSGTHIEDGDALLMNTADGHVYLDSKGYGDYTFTISDVTLTNGVYYPTVSVSGPTSYQLELKRAYVKVDGDWYKDVDDAGGTVSAQTTESGHNFTITSGQYVAEGGSITYTATPTTPGFTFRGWYNNDYGYRISTENPYTSSNIRALEHFEGKFTEDTIDVTIANDGHGYVQISGSTVTAAKVGVITTREITAVAHPGYMFSHWTVPDGKNFNVASTTNATTTLSGLGSGSDGTLTAHFKPRYLLRGSETGGSESGMPGWSTTGGLEFTGTTSVEPSGTEPIPVNLTCTCTTLHPNKEYKFSIHDSVVNRNYGYATNLTDISSNSLLLNTENNNVKLYTAGYGTYVFQITYLSHDGNYYPTVKMLSRQASHTLTLGKNIDAGGSVSAQTNEGDGFAITNGQFFATGSDITFTASPNAGYYVEGWYSNAECTTPYNGEDDDVTIGEYNLTLTLSSISDNKTVYAKFAKIWSVYLNSEHTYWSTYTKTDGDDIYTFNIDLPANSQYTFTINDNGAGSVYKIANNYYMDYSNHTNWGGFDTDKTYACGIKTAGKGTYTFTWNATDKVLSVTYPTSYTVTFGYGTGGSAVTATVDEVAITSGQYATSDKAISFTKTAATGYTFKGWYDAASDGTAISYMASDDVYDKIEGNISVYAQFTANTYTIEYDANDAQYYGAATGSTTSSSHTYDEAKNLTSNGFSRAGFDFAGWNTAADGSGSSYTNGQSVTNLSATQDETVTLYARWTAHELTITLDDNGGSGGSPASLTAVYGRTAKADGGGMFDGITDPTRTGYTFGGWWTNTDGTGTEIITSAHFYHWTTDYVDKDGKWKYDGNVTAYAKWTPVALTFTGATDSDWGTASNWSPECVPTLGHDVTIQAPVLVAADHATAKSIVLDQNSHTGKLTIQANKGLEVAGTITRTTDGSNRLATRLEDLILESSSAGNASLIFNNSNACQATVMMYSKATIVGNTWNWQYVGTPFTGSIPLYNYYGSWMYKWNNGSWEVVHGGDELTPFAGYCLTQNSATTHVMGGTLVPTTSKSVTMAASTDMVLANSWTAPISIASFDIEGSDATFTSTPATVYLFNTGMAEDGSEEGTEAGTYISVPINSATYTGNGLIAPMQGFFVTTNGVGGTSGSITLNYNDLVRPAGNHTDIVAGPMKMRKQEETKPDVMKIRANGALYNDRVVILAREDFSDGFDNGWDGEKMSFGEVAPSVYVINEQGGYDAVSAIPSFEGTVVGFRAGANNSCTMSFEYDGDETLYLNDLQAQMSTLISEENNYTFTTSAGDSEVRFIISATPIQKVPTGIEHSVVSGQPSEVRKLIINDHVYIIRSGRMYGVDGQMIK